ncbi:MAG: PEGA domain-containing protein [Candidatus Eisenbacteria bacterium]
MAKGLEGTIIANRYELISMLGRGSYASVWKARQLDVQAEVAVKILNPSYADDPALVEDFIAEARGFVAFRDNPRIVTILDCGQDLDTGLTYVAMTLHAETLDAMIRAHGALPVERVMKLAEDLGAALRTVHRGGLVHRDIKSSNILTVDGDDRFVLSDFAVGMFADQDERTAPTVDMSRIGNWAYAAPERIHATQKSEVGPGADLYSAGVVLFRAATGRYPFESRFPQIISDHLKSEPPDPRSLRPELPRPLADIILRCLRKDPAQRFGSADELLAALAEARTVRESKLPIDLKSRPVIFGAAALAGLVLIVLLILALLPGGLEAELQTQPEGAAFRLYAGEVTARFDAIKTGTTPAKVRGLEERSYTVVMEKDGYFPKEVTFTPAKGRSGPDVIVLESSIDLRVTSDPEGAWATLRPLGSDQAVDGGRTPADFHGLRAGPHELMLRLENFATLIDTVLIGRDGGTITRKLHGGGFVALDVVTEPDGAQIYIDGTKVGELSACRVPNLAPGTHRVEFELKGYAPFDTTLDLDGARPVVQLAVLLAPTANPKEPAATATRPTTALPSEPSRNQQLDRLEQLQAAIPEKIRRGEWDSAERDLNELLQSRPDEPHADSWKNRIESGRTEQQRVQNTAAEQEKPQVRRTLQLYRESLEQKDVKTFARLWIALPARELEEFQSSFERIESQTVEVSETGLEIKGNQATLRFHEKRRIRSEDRREVVSARDRVMKLRRIGDGEWLIASLE